MQLDDKNNRFFIEKNNELLGEIKFTPLTDEDTLTIDHTFVKESARGHGYAHDLLMAVINLAENSNKKIIPICPYARFVFNKEPSLRYILQEKYLNNLEKKES